MIDGKLTAQAESINGLVAQVTPDAAGDTDWAPEIAMSMREQ